MSPSTSKCIIPHSEYTLIQQWREAEVDLNGNKGRPRPAKLIEDGGRTGEEVEAEEMQHQYLIFRTEISPSQQQLLMEREQKIASSSLICFRFRKRLTASGRKSRPVEQNPASAATATTAMSHVVMTKLDEDCLQMEEEYDDVVDRAMEEKKKMEQLELTFHGKKLGTKCSSLSVHVGCKVNTSYA